MKLSKNEIPTLRRKLTKIFNAYIRLRDKDKGCISCVTRPVQNAGHYKSTGSAPQPSMRFNEKNVHGQCIYCNYTLGGNAEGYKKGLIKRYGKEVIKKLMIQKSIKQNPWKRFEYIAMIDLYTKKLKDLA